MRDTRKTRLIFAAVLFASAGAVSAGQPVDVNALPDGARFCPAPWADNSQFMQSYFSVDARTGQMTRHDPGSGSVSVDLRPPEEEQVLFVSPPISVENVYVPPPGGSPVPPQTRATGVMRQPQRQQYRAPQQQQRRPQQQMARQQPQAYRQPQPYAQPQMYAQPQAYQQPQVYRQPQPQVYAQTQPYPPHPYPQQPQRPLHPYPQQQYGQQYQQPLPQ